MLCSKPFFVVWCGPAARLAAVAGFGLSCAVLAGSAQSEGGQSQDVVPIAENVGPTNPQVVEIVQRAPGFLVARDAMPVDWSVSDGIIVDEPQFRVYFSDWNFDPETPENGFTYVPDETAERIVWSKPGEDESPLPGAGETAPLKNEATEGNKE